MIRRPPRSTLFPSTTLSRSNITGSATWNATAGISSGQGAVINIQSGGSFDIQNDQTLSFNLGGTARSEEHTTELQSPDHAGSRLPLFKEITSSFAAPTTVMS